MGKPDTHKTVFNISMSGPKKQLEFNFVTGNINKFNEAKEILGEGFSLVHVNTDLQEIQGTIIEVVTAKCKQAASIFNGPVMIEDTSLGFEAFDHKLPGPYVKSFLEAGGPQMLPRILSDYPNKNATAVCMVAYTGGPHQDVFIFPGQMNGEIVQPRGTNGFGWDAVFQPDGFNDTFAEMSTEMKNLLSPRMKAFEKLKRSVEDVLRHISS